MELTPKEEAKNIYNQMLELVTDAHIHKERNIISITAKQCSLICIDEKIKTGIDLNGDMFSGFIERLQDIKEAIQSL